MCGVAAIFSYSGGTPSVDASELVAIRDAMAARGPDGAGLWISPDQRVGLAHRRLAIIDVSQGGAQPMHSADGRFCITYNGEIYNYGALRDELERSGARFRSTSDTEVLLHLYAAKGEGMLRDLRGMFAFAIWDNVRKGLFVARDPFGIKPLYWSIEKNILRVASQVKGLLAGGALSHAPDLAGHVGFFLFGSVPEPHTTFKDIHALPAGTCMWVDEKGPGAPRKYFDIAQDLIGSAPPILDPEQRQQVFREALVDSVRHHLVADVPVGVFLSAGLDSTTLTGLAAELSGRKLHTITLGFSEYKGTGADETILAEKVAAHYGTTHHTRWFSSADFAAELDRIFDSMDLPSVDGVNTYFVSKAAVDCGLKVALSGLGGDELLGGYPSFRQIPKLAATFAWANAFPSLGRGARKLSLPLLRRLTSPKYAGLVEYGGRYSGAYLLRRALFMPWELPQLMDPDAALEGLAQLDVEAKLNRSITRLQDPRSIVSLLETTWYMRNQLLRDADWAGMAHSLEIRVPLVDRHLWSIVAPSLRTRFPFTKQDLGKVPARPLFADILNRAKTGFVIPVPQWAAEERDYGNRPVNARGWAQYVHDAHWAKPLIAPPRPALSRPTEPRSILVFRVGQLGDSIVALPAIAALKQKYPKHRFILLTDRRAGHAGWVSSWDVMGPTKWFDEVYFHDHGSSSIRAAAKELVNIVRLRSRRIDHVYNLAVNRSTAQRFRDRVILQYLTGARRYHSEEHRVCANSTAVHARSEFEWLRLVKHVQPRARLATVENFRLPIPSLEYQKARKLLDDLSVRSEDLLLAVGPGSKMPAKEWPEVYFKELGLDLLARFSNLKLVVVGGESEKSLGDRLCTVWGTRSQNFAGRLSVFESASLLAHCTAYVGNDTGAMHLAGAVGTPCVAIFSARDISGRWEPIGAKHRILRNEPDCAGCMLEICIEQAKKCLTQITAQSVFQTCSELLVAEQKRACRSNRLMYELSS